MFRSLPVIPVPALLFAVSANAQTAPAPTPSQDIVVTAARRDLVGRARTASEGEVSRKEIESRPVYRAAQLLESVPGLTVTAHSGEGKASQYLLRGVNLDHGTDFASFVEAMPVNRPTNTHGQGYSDQNFVLPELVAGLDYTKGPYYAPVGDFGAVGSARMRLVDRIPTTLSASVGTLGDQALFAGTTLDVGRGDRLLVAGELVHLDGPWTHPDDYRKLNAALRFSGGDAADGYSLTALYHEGSGNLTTDQPARAVSEGLIGRYGTLDPSDGSRSHRWSLSGTVRKPLGPGTLDASAYFIRSNMTLWNDFTHFLDDPVNGDQEEQFERRDTLGGEVAWRAPLTLGGMRSDLGTGVQLRHDSAYVSRLHTRARDPLATCSVEGDEGPAQVATPGGVCNADQVGLLDLGPWAELTTHWAPWLRTVLGARWEYYDASDRSLTTGFSGARSQTLFQPKASFALGPWKATELYLSAGRGFHSDDVRGVFGTVPAVGIAGTVGTTPLLARVTGYELGLRSEAIRRVQLEVALFREDFASELAYNADIGQDEASAPSRRQGVDLSGRYRPFGWLTLDADLALVRARYRGDLAAEGLSGPFIANAPRSTLSLGATVEHPSGWFGAARLRGLGAYPLTDGPRNPSDSGYTEVSLDIGRHLGRRVSVTASVFNLLNTHANAAAYDYVSRLPGEPAAGVDDRQLHPLEPRSLRFTITTTL